MKLGMQGKFILHKQKVKMLNGMPLLNDNGEQILVGDPVKAAEFDNLITDAGLNELANLGSGVARFFYLSNDNTPPAVTDKALIGLLGGSETNESYGIKEINLTTPPYSITRFATKRFAAGIATGNISKIATGWGSVQTPAGLWSSALVKDDNGAAVISKQADEILDVTYMVTTYLSDIDYIGTVDISGADYNVVVRPAQLKAAWFGYPSALIPFLSVNEVRASSSNIPDVFGFIDGFANATGSVTAAPYIANSYQKSYVASFTVDNANFTDGIRSVEFHYNAGNARGNYWQVQFDKVSDGTAIPKTNNHTLTLPPFTISWGRYEGTL